MLWLEILAARGHMQRGTSGQFKKGHKLKKGGESLLHSTQLHTGTFSCTAGYNAEMGSHIFESEEKKRQRNLHQCRWALEEICQRWQFLPGALQTLVWWTVSKLSSEFLSTHTLSDSGLGSKYTGPNETHARSHTHTHTHKVGGDQYERGIYMSQSWSSASVWQNTQVPVVVNYCFDRMSLQFCRVCVRAPSAARLLFISGLRLLSLSRGESGRPRQTDRGRERERERQGGREREAGK